MIIRRLLGVAVLTLVAACATIPSLYDTQARIARYISSGQYDKEFSAVVARAQAYMERRAGAVSKPAIVLDIDETSLSNWPAYRMKRRSGGSSPSRATPSS